MVDGEGGPVVEQQRLAPRQRRRDVDGRSVVPDDLEVRRRVVHQRFVEPGEVFTHQSPGQVVGGPNSLTPGTDAALVTHPAVAADHCPLVQAYGVGRGVVLVGGGVEGELTAGVVEHQEVGLLGGVNPASELSGLDDVHPHRRPYPPGPVHRSLQNAQTPGAEPHDGQLDHRTRPIAARQSWPDLSRRLQAHVLRLRNGVSACVAINDMCSSYWKQPDPGLLGRR